MSLVEVISENLGLYKNIKLTPGKIYFRKTNDPTIPNHYIPFSIKDNSKNSSVKVGNLLHRPKRKMRQNAVMIYISYNYVSSNLLNVPLLFSCLKKITSTNRTI